MTDHRDIVRAQLRVDEGVVPHAYQDSEGFWTIGIGRLIDQRKGGGLSKEEIALLLENDIAKAEEAARALVPSFDMLSANRRAALVNMAFNLGRGGLAGFARMRAAIDAGDFKRAADEALDSRWARQVGVRALTVARMLRDG